MFRSISLLLVLVVLGLTAGEPKVAPEVIQVTNTTGDENTKTELAQEKRELDKQLCAGNKGIETVTNGTDKPANISTNEKIDETTLSEEKGPKKVIILEEKVEVFPDNVSKIVAVKEVAEKLPSNDIVKEITVERKTIKDTDTETDEPKKEITVEIEVEKRVSKKNADVQVSDKVSEGKNQELKEKIKDIKQEVEQVKEELKEEEKESKKIDPSLCKLQEPVTTVTKTVEKVPEAVKVVEKLVPVVKTEEKIGEKVQPVVSLGGNVTKKVTSEVKNEEVIVVKKDNNAAEEIVTEEAEKEAEVSPNVKEITVEKQIVNPSNGSNLTTKETKLV